MIVPEGQQEGQHTRCRKREYIRGEAQQQRARHGSVSGAKYMCLHLGTLPRPELRPKQR